MVVLRTETFSNCDNSYFRRTFLLYSRLKREKHLSFAAEDPGLVGKKIKKRIELFDSAKPEDILDSNPSSIIFDLKNFKDTDILLARESKKRNINIIQFADYSQKPVDAAFLINPGIVPADHSISSDKFISGPEYIVLHNRFIHFNRVNKKYTNRVKKIFISLNNSFKYRELRDISDNLIRHGFLVKIDSGNYLKKFNKKTLKRIYPGIRFTGKRDNLARAFYEADISITAPGIRSYESAAAGTPGFYLYSNEKEKKIASFLEMSQTGAGAERGKFLYSREFIDLIHKRFSGEKMEMMGKKGKNLIDGRGLFRIIDILKEKKLI